MKRVYLVRHAQSEYNEKGVFQGRLDSDLTPLGFVQARLCAQEFIGKNIQVIYSSPQRRAYKTAIAIGDVVGLPVKVDERIKEMSFGIFEGKHFWTIMEENRDMFKNWLKNPLKHPLPTQEDMEEFKDRVKDFLEDIKRCQYENILVVAHGGSLHALICLATGLGLENNWNIHMDNTGISLLEYENSTFHLRYLNKTCHLKNLV